MTLFIGVMFFPLIDEFGVFQGSLIFLGIVAATWTLFSLLALEQYARYQFDENGFTIKYALGQKKIAYKWIKKIDLDKTSSIIYLKVKFDVIKIYTPIGLSPEDIYLTLLEGAGLTETLVTD
jgi:hypothetical protein